MLTLRHAVPIIALVLIVGACGGTPGASPSGPPSATATPASSGAATDAAPTDAPTDAAPTAAPVTLADLGGTWTFVASNPRILAASGGHTGGTVVIEGNRYTFTAGDFSAEGPIEFSGTKAVTCSTSSCKIEGVPIHQLFLTDGELAILNAGMLTPLGTFGDGCADWEDIPGDGVVTVESTGTVAGVEVPTVVTFADGDAGGVGTACESGSHVVTWDVTATRQP